MRQKRLARSTKYIILLWVLFIGLASGPLLFLLFARDPISKRGWDRIQLGMTREQVESILGPPGSYGPYVGYYEQDSHLFPYTEPEALPNYDHSESWTSPDLDIQVAFDAEDRVLWRYHWYAGRQISWEERIEFLLKHRRWKR